MSYILDALRRADAERERGVVPGLHAQPDIAELAPAARARRPLLLAAAGGGALLIAIVALLVVAPWRGAPSNDLHRPDAGEASPAGVRQDPSVAGRPAAPARADTGSPASPTLAAAPEGRAEPMPGANPGIATLAPDGSVRHVAIAPPAEGPPVDEAPSARRSAGAMPSERPAPAREAAPEPRPAAAARPPAVRGAGPADDARAAAGRSTSAGSDAAANGQPAPGTRSPAAAAPPVEHYGPPLADKTPPAPAPAPAVRNVNDLPPTLRSQMPRLAVGGAIYSDTPSGRMLILNGQIYHEGDHPTPDTLIEQIRLKSAVLSFRGTRYEITY